MLYIQDSCFPPVVGFLRGNNYVFVFLKSGRNFLIYTLLKNKRPIGGEHYNQVIEKTYFFNNKQNN